MCVCVCVCVCVWGGGGGGGSGITHQLILFAVYLNLVNDACFSDG